MGVPHAGTPDGPQCWIPVALYVVGVASKNTANGATPATRLGTMSISRAAGADLGSVMAPAAPVITVVVHPGLASTPPTLETLPVTVDGRTVGSVPATVILVAVAVVAVLLTLVRVGIFVVI